MGCLCRCEMLTGADFASWHRNRNMSSRIGNPGGRATFFFKPQRISTKLKNERGSSPTFH
jgi:hypothetical protein